MEQSPHLNLFDPHSEVAEALIGFLSDSSYLHLDALFQKDIDSIFAPPSSSPKRYCFPELLINEQLPPLLDPLPPLLDPLPPLLDPLPPLSYPAIVVAPDMGGCAENHHMSAQSVAARERRKRISERTQKLSQLIPGGTKMNTAEMLQAAFKYVKFLEAQVAILGVVDFVPENEYLQALLGSTAVQERLSAEGLCIVPREMVDHSAGKPNIESGPLI